jgi:hypothetical protein
MSLRPPDFLIDSNKLRKSPDTAPAVGLKTQPRKTFVFHHSNLCSETRVTVDVHVRSAILSAKHHKSNPACLDFFSPNNCFVSICDSIQRDETTQGAVFFPTSRDTQMQSGLKCNL